MEKRFRVGYTTGVFDLFHIGHLNILKQSKEHCDYLIVGVSTDECVMQYKNVVPIIPFEERKAIVEAIKYVDRVVPQMSMNKLEAWHKLGFNVLFHGDDWKGSELYNRYEAELSNVGVSIVFLPHTSGTSSTQLSRRLLEWNKHFGSEG